MLESPTITLNRIGVINPHKKGVYNQIKLVIYPFIKQGPKKEKILYPNEYY